MWAIGLDFLHSFNEIEAVAVMLLNARCDREDIRVKDDIFRRKTYPGQQVIGTRANLDLAILGIGLPRFVEGHHNRRGTICHAQPCTIY